MSQADKRLNRIYILPTSRRTPDGFSYLHRRPTRLGEIFVHQNIRRFGRMGETERVLQPTCSSITLFSKPAVIIP